jgi:hypothetical protein
MTKRNTAASLFSYLTATCSGGSTLVIPHLRGFRLLSRPFQPLIHITAMLYQNLQCPGQIHHDSLLQCATLQHRRPLGNQRVEN